MSDETLTMTLLMTPDKANFSGKVHGGAMLKMLDEVAYACASRYAGCYVVTVSVDQVTFKEPVHVGELVTFKAAGKTTPVPPYTPVTDVDRARFEAARLRRELRREIERRHAEIKARRLG